MIRSSDLQLLPYGVVRAPRLPISEALALLEVQHEDAELETQELVARIESILTRRPRALDLIATGSSTLAKHWREGRRGAKAASAMRRYLVRAATRPTPFGWLSATGAFRWGTRFGFPDAVELDEVHVERPTKAVLPFVHRRGQRICLTDPLFPYVERSIAFTSKAWRALRDLEEVPVELAAVRAALARAGFLTDGISASDVPVPTLCSLPTLAELPNWLGERLAKRAFLYHRSRFPTVRERRWATFRDHFRERYTHEWVRLPDLADSLISGVQPPTQSGPAPGGRDEKRRNEWLFELYERGLKQDLEVELTRPPRETDWEFRSACYSGLELAAMVFATSPDALDRGEVLIYPSSLAGTCAPFQSAGRFLWALPDELSEFIVQRQREIEAADGSVHAEIVFSASARFDQLMRTRHGWSSELLFNGLPKEQGRRIIRPEDVLVGVTGDQFALRLTSGESLELHQGHLWNTEKAPRIIDITSRLSWLGHPALGRFQWGHLDRAISRPRVVSGKQVVSLAGWRVSKVSRAADSLRCLDDWRASHAVPAIVSIVEHDQRLPVNLNANWGLQELRRALAQQPEVYLEEIPWAREPVGEDAILLEVVASFERRREIKPPHAVPVVAAKADPRWVSLRIRAPVYGQVSLARAMRARLPGKVGDWHFVRMPGDGEGELRFRATFPRGNVMGIGM